MLRAHFSRSDSSIKDSSDLDQNQTKTVSRYSSPQLAAEMIVSPENRSNTSEIYREVPVRIVQEIVGRGDDKQ